MAIFDRAIVRLLPAVPKPVVRKLSARYIAGAELSHACRVVREQNETGKSATIDVLGEDITNATDARAMVKAYQEVLAQVDEHGLDSNVSVKPTSLGIKIGYECLHENLEKVVATAAERSNFVRIEMEDSTCTDDTLRIFRELRDEGHANVGIVLQAYLRRTLADARALTDLRPNVRLVKGIYVEPSSIAFKEFDAVRASYVNSLEELLDAGAYVGIATHDEWLISEGLRLVERHGLAPDEYEFQMLLGVRPEIGDRLVAEGHRLRIYVPFGRHWYAYSLRRLQENPRIAGYIAADTLNRFLPGNGRSSAA